MLIVGNGGREHAVYNMAKKSPLVTEIFCAPGNPAMKNRVDIKVTDIQGLINFAIKELIDLTIVGPEAPLAMGIVDQFRAHGLSIFGPVQAAAKLESSKSDAKKIMAEGNVPTAKAEVFEWSRHQSPTIIEALNQRSYPFVLKADGLAAGKGVRICRQPSDVTIAINEFSTNKFGAAGDVILLEDFLVGPPNLPRPEISIFALVDIHGNFKMMLPAQDYKPINDGDQGQNTGGMGSYAPVPWVTKKMMTEIGKNIFEPVIKEMIDQSTPFSGLLYAGLMYTTEGFKVVEFNVRFGDPEIQPLSMLLKTDIIHIMKIIADGGSIADIELEWKSGGAVCIVMAANGYPDSYSKRDEITGLNTAGVFVNAKVFFAGVETEHNKLVTAGGRVLGITVYHPDGIESAASTGYIIAGKIKWGDGETSYPVYRHDIAKDVPLTV